MMFPFVTQSHFNDVIAAKDKAIADRDTRLASLEKENHRLIDLVFKHQFGEQVHDTIPVTEQIEQEMTPERAAEDDAAREHQREMDELAVIKRTRPSLLGRKMSQMFSRSTFKAAIAANPPKTVQGNAQVAAIFEKARKTAIPATQ